jgi:hypothetical protein
MIESVTFLSGSPFLEIDDQTISMLVRGRSVFGMVPLLQLWRSLDVFLHISAHHRVSFEGDQRSGPRSMAGAH